VLHKAEYLEYFHTSQVKLPVVHFDVIVNFNIHITDICRKAGRKQNVLAGLFKHLILRVNLYSLINSVQFNFSPNNVASLWYCRYEETYLNKYNIKERNI